MGKDYRSNSDYQKQKKKKKNINKFTFSSQKEVKWNVKKLNEHNVIWSFSFFFYIKKVKDL